MKSAGIQYDKIRTIIKYEKKDLFPFLAGILYICSELTRGTLRFLIPFFSEREVLVYGIQDSIIVILVILSYLTRYGTKNKKIQIWPIYVISFGSIVWSVLFHPEYREWFKHSEYGLTITIFHMTSGIFGLLIFGLFNDKKKIFSMLVYGCRLNLLWHIYEYSAYLKRGYWEAYLGDGTLARLDYGLNYGYRVVLCAIFFMILCVYNKKMIDLISFVISLMLVIICGSRGPLLCIAISSLLLFTSIWSKNKGSKIKFLFLFSILLIGLVLFVAGIPVLMEQIIKVLKNANISTRTIQMLLNGEIMNDSGRSKIYEIAFEMIKNGGLLGYGFYGDRYVIGRTWHYGYPHNLFLEWLIQYGVLFGGMIIITFLVNVIRMIFKCKDSTWQALFITLLGATVKLWLSDSFWYYWPFWALVALLEIWNKEEGYLKRRKRIKFTLSVKRR